MLHLAALAIDTTTTGAPIEYATVLTGTSVTLTLDEYTYTGPDVVQDTRGFNSGLVGPTIRVTPGTTLSLTLTNNLETAAYDTRSLHNEFRQLSVTNLHTHGLHISGQTPGDSIFTEVNPGASNTYTYVIPADHMGGTMWYHPHHHGSTAVHAGGGAAGMIIVEDQSGFLPTEYANMEEKLLMFQVRCSPPIMPSPTDVLPLLTCSSTSTCLSSPRSRSNVRPTQRP